MLDYIVIIIQGCWTGLSDQTRSLTLLGLDRPRPQWAQAYIGAGGFPPLGLDLELGLILDGDLVGLPEHNVEKLLPVIDSCFIARRLSS